MLNRPQTGCFSRELRARARFLCSFTKRSFRSQREPIFEVRLHRYINSIAATLTTYGVDDAENRKKAAEALKAVIANMPLSNQTTITNFFKHLRYVGKIRKNETDQVMDNAGLIAVLLPALYSQLFFIKNVNCFTFIL